MKTRIIIYVGALILLSGIISCEKKGPMESVSGETWMHVNPNYKGPAEDYLTLENTGLDGITGDPVIK